MHDHDKGARKAPSKKALETRTRILEAGERLILAKSFTAVGISEVLSASNVPKGSFYYYFTSKEDFGVQLIARHAEIYGRALDRLLNNDAPDAKQKLLHFFRFHVGYYQDNGCVLDCLVVKLSSEVSTLSEALRQALLHATASWSEKFSNMVRQGQADGSIDPALDADSTGTFLFSYWLGANAQVSISRSVAPFEAIEDIVEKQLR